MKTYTLFGCGGTGSQLLGPLLAYLSTHHGNRSEEFEVLLVDGDNFESGNLERQLFSPNFVGQNKAQALAQTYAHYPVEAYPIFAGMKDLKHLIPEDSVTLIAVDNFSLRAIVEYHVSQLKNAVVINAGNELETGTMQLWVREKGKNKTPILSYGHPEIRYLSADDRSNMTCAQVAEMPGGGQIILANTFAANLMLQALWTYHTNGWKKGWNYADFDLRRGGTNYLDIRERRRWDQKTSIVIPDEVTT